LLSISDVHEAARDKEIHILREIALGVVETDGSFSSFTFD